MTQADIRPEDLAALRRLRDQGALQLAEVGTGVDPNMLWFNLTPGSKVEKTKPYLLRTEFRQAIAYAIDRDAIVNTLYLGAATPIYGPVTPGNRIWYSDSAPKYPHDPARAKALLAGLGLTDRNGDGMLDDASGKPVQFSIITQAGNIRERVATVMQEQLRQAGIKIDIVGLDPPVDRRPLRRRGLRQHLLRLPGELVRSGDEPGLLAERRIRARLEHRGAGAVGEDRSTT